MKPIPAETRFFRFVAQDGDCWTWTGTTNRGYGHFRTLSGRLYAHRWSFEFFRGAIPEGLTIDHLCRNKACVNPDHLDPVPGRINTLRSEGITAALAKATRCVNGHEFTEANTIQRATGGRKCRTCANAIHARRRAQQRSAAA